MSSETSLFGANEVHVGQDLGGRTTTISAADVARECEHWLREIRATNPELAIVVGITHTDQAPSFTLGPVREAPPYPGIRPFPVLSAELDDPERLAIAFEVTARALPPPKPKKPKVPKADRAKTTRAGARAKGLPKTRARRKAKANT